MAITQWNNRSINRSDTAASGQLWTATSATASDFQAGNTPMVFAKPSTSQSISNATETNVTLGTEVFDTDSAFASNTFTVPSGKGGKYLVTGFVRNSNFDAARAFMYIMSGGGNYVFEQGSGSVHNTVGGSILLELDAAETVHLRYYHNNGSTQSITNDGTWFSVMKMNG